METLGQTGAVAVVLALLGLTLWWLRRRGLAGVLPARRSTGRRLECLERMPLGPQHTLHLVRLGETSLLVASSPAGCALVHTFSTAEMEGERRAGR